jgi:GNAT superfamily N-acetyltransferase
MDEITIRDISTDRHSYRDQVAAFFRGLGEERSFIDISEARVMNSPVVIAALDGPRIIGLTGVGRKSLFLFTFIIINRAYQGRGLGRRLTAELMAQVRRFRSLTFSVMLDANVPSLKQHLAAGAQLVGHRKGTSYLFWPPAGPAGALLRTLIAAAFPFVKLYDICHDALSGTRKT